MIDIKGCNYIAGQSSSQGKLRYKSINPQTKEESKIFFYEATKKEINQSIAAAIKAFQLLQNSSLSQLTTFLTQLSEEIYNLDDQLIQVANWETALPFQRLENERKRTCDQLKLFADFISKRYHLHPIIDSGNIDDPSGKPDIRKMLIPIGPVLIFPASNFPFAFGVCGGDVASAWAAGCPVIIKTNPLHPQTAELFAKAVYNALRKSSMPLGMFSLLHIKDLNTLKELTNHPDLEAIGFTGSLKVGRAIFNLASSRIKPIPVYAEMGSNNPVFLTENALRKRGEAIAQSLADSISLGVGQFCTKPGIIFIPEKQDSFIQSLTDFLKEKKDGVMLSNGIKVKLVNKVRELLSVKQVTMLCDDLSQKNNNHMSNMLFFTDSTTFIKQKTLHQEFFGPLAILVEYTNMKDLMSIINRLDGQLTATFHLTEDDYGPVKPLLTLLRQKVGRIIFNGVPTGVEVCYAMQHGGPYPATTAPQSTSVGMDAIFRFLRPIAFQNMPEALLPDVLKNKNETGILRLINKIYTTNDVERNVKN